MPPITTDEAVTERRGMSRRELIRNAGIAGAVAWTAPLIIDSVGSPAAALTPAPGCYFYPYVIKPSGGGCTVATGGAAGLRRDMNPSTRPTIAPLAAPIA